MGLVSFSHLPFGVFVLSSGERLAVNLMDPSIISVFSCQGRGGRKDMLQRRLKEVQLTERQREQAVKCPSTDYSHDTTHESDSNRQLKTPYLRNIHKIMKDIGQIFHVHSTQAHIKWKKPFSRVDRIG